jgi:hypothetical protein
MRKWINTVVSFVVGFLFGIICVKSFHLFSQLHFDPKFDFGNVIWAVTTLCASVLLAAFLQRGTQSDRMEKELLLRQLNLALDIVTELERFRDGGPVTAIAATLKKLSMKCTSIVAMLKHLKYSASICKEANYEALLKQIRKLSTDTPIKQIEAHAKSSECSSVVRNGIMELAQEKRSLLDTKVSELKERLFKLQILVNRH